MSLMRRSLKSTSCHASGNLCVSFRFGELKHVKSIHAKMHSDGRVALEYLESDSDCC